MLEPITAILGQANLGQWLTEDSLVRNVGFSALFVLLTVLIISAGVEQGIEKWSSSFNAFTVYFNVSANHLCTDSRRSRWRDSSTT